MRSNKERWLRGGAVLAWIAVLACAAYASVNFTRKDWRDFTPIEKIGFFTPNWVQWGSPPVALMYPPSRIEIAEVRGPLGSFLLVWPHLRPGELPTLARVGADSLQLEVVRDSEMARAIDACLERGIRFEGTDARVRMDMERLRARLARGEPAD